MDNERTSSHLPRFGAAISATITAWRAEGAPDDWWQEVAGSDGQVYDVNIYDARTHGDGRGDGMVYCVYPTRVLASGSRDTVVDEPVARGVVS